MAHLSPRRDFLKFASLVGGSAALTSLAHTASTAADNPLVSFVNVLDHGVAPGGKVKNTLAINRLIERVAATGGGMIFFPAGRYLTGAIHLQSHITVHLDAGAVLQFSTDFDDYLPMVPTRWQGQPASTFSALIRAYRAENIALTGHGEIDGGGAAWWDMITKVRTEARATGKAPASKWLDLFIAANTTAEGAPKNPESSGFLRPSLFQAIECTQVVVAGLLFRNSPFWSIHFINCEHVVADGISVFAPDSPNTDGINPESSRNVHIANCRFENDDDCITIKSGKGPWARAHAGPSENITITNCIMTRGASGVGIGSEMSGDVRRVTISNCVFDGTLSGIHIKANRGRGGIVEDIVCTNLVMNNIPRPAAIHLNMEYWIKTTPEPFNEGTPRFRNIQISHVRGTKLRKALEITGLVESPIQGVTLSDLDLAGTEGLTAKYADDIRMNNVRITAEDGAPFLCESCTRLQLRGIEARTGNSDSAQIGLHDVQHAIIGSSGGFETGRPFLTISGAATRAIRVLPDNPPAETAPVKVASDVPAAEVIRS